MKPLPNINQIHTTLSKQPQYLFIIKEELKIHKFIQPRLVHIHISLGADVVRDILALGSALRNLAIFQVHTWPQFLILFPRKDF